jgi:hypothetical protein
VSGAQSGCYLQFFDVVLSRLIIIIIIIINRRAYNSSGRYKLRFYVIFRKPQPSALSVYALERIYHPDRFRCSPKGNSQDSLLSTVSTDVYLTSVTFTLARFHTFLNVIMAMTKRQKNKTGQNKTKKISTQLNE